MSVLNSKVLVTLGLFIFVGFFTYLTDMDKDSFILKFVASIPYGDKITHLSFYGLMALFLNYIFNFKSYKVLGFNLQLGAILVLTFAGLEEITQYWVPSRTCDVVDFVFDAVGVTLFSLLYRGK